MQTIIKAWVMKHALIILSIYFVFASSVVRSENNTVLKVGVFDNKPIVFQKEDGSYAGVSIDVINSIAEKEGWSLEYVHGTWKSVLTKLENGEIDLLVGIAYKAERTKRFDFTKETLMNNWGVVYRNPSVAITSLEDIQGKRVALMSRSIHSRIFRGLMKGFSFDFTAVEVPNYLVGLEAVHNKQADAVVINRVMSILTAPEYDVMETGVIFNPVEVRYASKKGLHAEILSAIDRHLVMQKKYAQSAYHQSLNKWFGTANKTKFPDWLYPAVLILVMLFTMLLVSNAVIRRKVARKTSELSESELRFRQLAENINEVFWVGSPDWQQVFYVSPAYEREWGHSRNHLYKKPMLWLDYVHEDDQQKVIDDIRVKATGNLSKPDFPEYRLIFGDGSIHWILARAYPIYDEVGRVVRIAGIAEDITERKNAQQTIRFMAYHDALTKLENRNAFESKLHAAIQHANTRNKQHILMYIDLDQFKVVNDTCGHTAGDEMLKELASILQSVVSDGVVLARLGGDEFGLLIENASLERGMQVGQEVLDAIQDFRFSWEERKFSVGASIGMVVIGASVKSMSELLSAADMACYAAKEKGRNRIHVYNEDDEDLLQRHGEMQWVSRLKHALEEDRFVVYQQEIVSLQQNNAGIKHHEFLLRLLDEEGELIPPNAFLPAAERFDLMPSLDRWVVACVLKYLGQLPCMDEKKHKTIYFINLSAQALTDDGFIEFILHELEVNKVSPQNVCFEITETAAIANLKTAISFIDRLKAKGCHFALDDFGTGMSSFSYLSSLPVDFLKIDGSFIRDMLENPMNASIVDAVTRIGHNAGLQMIAEWVESEEVYRQLVEIGIDFAQGYAIARPAPLHHQSSEYLMSEVANRNND